MTQDGVNSLSLAEIARRLGVQPPSIYKYCDSLLHIYDATATNSSTSKSWATPWPTLSLSCPP
jgi:hypothetical protein